MLEEYLKKEKKIVDAEIETFFKDILKSESIQNTLLADYIKKVQDFLLPKNIRIDYYFGSVKISTLFISPCFSFP